MLIFWRIRYLDRSDKTFKDRDLFLDTATLPPAKRAAVELLTESKNSRDDWEFLKLKSLFREQSPTDVSKGFRDAKGGMKMFSLLDYFEDEVGQRLTSAEMSYILSGKTGGTVILGGAKQYQIDYLLAPKAPLPIAEVSLSAEELQVFGYFVRDLFELQDSTLMKEGPGTLSTGGTRPSLPDDDHLETSVKDEEIRSFITIFRRLYMEREPANFLKAAALFESKLVNHPLGKLVKGVASEYVRNLQEVPDFCERRIDMNVTFTVKRLIDVYLYTQYAHQPNEQRQRQFVECLKQVGKRRNFLAWQFLTEVWKCGLEIGNAGRVIATWFKHYCEHHGITPDVLNSLRTEHTGLGTAETKEARKTRLFREKVEELELELWKQAGKPEGGPVQFRLIAQEQLRQALNGEEGNE